MRISDSVPTDKLICYVLINKVYMYLTDSLRCHYTHAYRMLLYSGTVGHIILQPLATFLPNLEFLITEIYLGNYFLRF